MLTESEKRWLRNKRLRGFRFDICRWCFAYPVAAWERAPSPCVIYCHNNGVPALCEGLHSARGLRDALEFSERVAVRLAKWDIEYHKNDHLCPYGDTDLDSYIPLCQCTDFCQSHSKLGCVEVKLAWIRLKVEREMDNENH